MIVSIPLYEIKTVLVTVEHFQGHGWWWWLFSCLLWFLGKVWQFILHLHFFFFLFLKLRSAYQFHFLGQDQSTVAQRAEATGWMFPDKLRLNLFPWSISTLYLDSVISLLQLSRVYSCWGVTYHLHFWQNDWGLLHATAVTQGGMDTPKSQHKKLTLENKIFQPLLPGLELATFQPWVLHSTNKLSKLKVTGELQENRKVALFFFYFECGSVECLLFFWCFYHQSSVAVWQWKC